MIVSHLHGRSIIGGGRSAAAGGTVFSATCPLTNETLMETFHSASFADVDSAVRAAAEAFETYRVTPSSVRAALLEKIADEIEALGESLIDRVHLETGLGRQRLVGERGRTVHQLRLFAETVREGSWVDARIDRAQPERQPLPKPDIRRMLQGMGPVAVFGASNFPLAFSVAGGDTASALAAGNPVMVKAHEAHPGTSEMVAEAIGRAIAACELPPGLFSMLHGPGATVGRALVEHPLTCAVGFTGSYQAGRALFDAAAARVTPIPVFAEMSSLNPVFILPEALKHRPAEIGKGLALSVTLGVGQFCTKPGLVFHAGGPGFDEFLASFSEAIQQTTTAPMVHEGIADSFRTKLETMRGHGIELIGGDKSRKGETMLVGPAIATTDLPHLLQNNALKEEVFGPFCLLVRAQTWEEIEEAGRTLDGQLTATLHATEDDIEKAGPLISVLERKAGRLILNGFPTGVEVCAAMHHGGPFPATTDSRFTSVGTAAISRFAKPICYQGFPQSNLPRELQDANPLGLMRLVDGELTREHFVQ